MLCFDKCEHLCNFAPRTICSACTKMCTRFTFCLDLIRRNIKSSKQAR